MKVYCAAPIRGSLEHKSYSDKIPSIVEASGNKPVCELYISSVRVGSDRDIYERDIEWLEESECVIAEVSSPSTGTGFEIAYALYELNIPVLALYHRTANVSAMIMGCTSSYLTLAGYSDVEEMEIRIKEFMDSVRISIERERIL